MIRINEEIVVLPLEYGIPQNLDKAILYKLERKLVKKVKQFHNNKYLIMDIEDRLQKIDCPTELGNLLEMKPFDIVEELLGKQGLIKYYLIDPYVKGSVEEVDMVEIKIAARQNRMRKKNILK